MRDPRVLDTRELESELADLRKARDYGMDEGAAESSFATTDSEIAAFEEELARRRPPE
ncbi:hypothetical protein [Antrihabitans cavernicola]|uniref:hypothetical protein n=1 Tax=Antrihabitans cavernicola TaxID=2495913 RepID=UPI001659DAEB|nr:hypothetical protein [Spelaeibacter cavernicola]